MCILGYCSCPRARTRTSSQPSSPNLSRQQHGSLPTQDLLVKLKKRIIVMACITFPAYALAPLLFTVIEAVIPVLLVFGTPTDLVLTPGETHAFSVNGFFCSSLSVDSSRLSASLYITEIDPQLTQHSNKTIEDVFECEMECYASWRSYLHEGSTVTISSHSKDSNTAYFTLFTSTLEFNTFLSSNFSTYVESSIPIHRTKRLGIVFEKKFSEGDYIFVIFTLDAISFDIVLQFNRTEFSTDLPYRNYCETHSYTHTDCNVSVPYSVHTIHGLLQVTYDGEDLSKGFEYISIS